MTGIEQRKISRWCWEASLRAGDTVHFAYGRSAMRATKRLIRRLEQKGLARG